MLRNGNKSGKNASNVNLRATIPNTDYGRKTTAGECGILLAIKLEAKLKFYTAAMLLSYILQYKI